MSSSSNYYRVGLGGRGERSEEQQLFPSPCLNEHPEGVWPDWCMMMVVLLVVVVFVQARRFFRRVLVTFRYSSPDGL